ncbi:MAG: hypothetical protein WC479_06730 [Candidatus Izemoplasmatales bacterium]|jgi:hypothetical protein
MKKLLLLLIFDFVFVCFVFGCNNNSSRWYDEYITELEGSSIYLIGDDINFPPGLEYTKYDSYVDIVDDNERVYIIINYQNTSFNLTNENLQFLENKLNNDNYVISFVGLKYYLNNLEGYDFLDTENNYSTRMIVTVRLDPDYGGHLLRLVADSADPESIIYDLVQIYE